MMKLVNITIPLSESEIDELGMTVNKRYLLSDVIEAHELCELINEGTGENYMDVSFITKDVTKIEPDLKKAIAGADFDLEAKIEIEDYQE
ncbi:hypothetical protein [Aquimarina longa]|uniref:hypothetical protein n=1 Tax=Aquimarina longa TaxID=1080221 RepID=UPI00078612FC|nr:hypothetical protein [Aquimarina longa]